MGAPGVGATIFHLEPHAAGVERSFSYKLKVFIHKKVNGFLDKLGILLNLPGVEKGEFSIIPRPLGPDRPM